MNIEIWDQASLFHGEQSGPRVGLLNIVTRMSPRVFGIEVSVDQLKRRNGSTNNQKTVWEVLCHR